MNILFLYVARQQHEETMTVGQLTQYALILTSEPGLSLSQHFKMFFLEDHWVFILSLCDLGNPA